MNRSALVLSFAATFTLPAQATPDLCALLTPADFQAEGIAGANAPVRNGEGNEAYCVYAGKSAATGGIELDVFIAPDEKEAKATYNEMRGGPGKAAQVPGAEQAEVALVKGVPSFTTIAVRRGKLAFGLGIPANAKSQDAATRLAKLALQRAEKLGR